MMRQWWVKLVVAVVIIVLLAFAGVKLYQTMLGLLGVVASGGEADLPGQEDPLEDSMWTQPPYVADDSAYDDVSAVREYEDAGE